MKNKPKYSNQQLSSQGLKRNDNGEIDHIEDKTAKSRKNDNVRPQS